MADPDRRALWLLFFCLVSVGIGQSMLFVILPPAALSEEVVDDYRSLRLSLKAHPVSFLRADLGRWNKWGRFLAAREDFHQLLVEERRDAERDASGRVDVLAQLVRQEREGGLRLSLEEISD